MSKNNTLADTAVSLVSSTNDEWEAFIKQDFRDRAEADGYDVYDDPDGEGFIIDLDGSYNPNN